MVSGLEGGADVDGAVLGRQGKGVLGLVTGRVGDAGGLGRERRPSVS